MSKGEKGIMKQTNQAVARHRLFTSLQQQSRSFSEWYLIVKEQAERCNFANYTVEKATRDALLYQTTDTKLQQRILCEDLDLDNTIKYGLAYEQSRRKVESLNQSRTERKEKDRIAKLEEKIRALDTNAKKAAKKKRFQEKGVQEQPKCGMCTFPVHTS